MTLLPKHSLARRLARCLTIDPMLDLAYVRSNLPAVEAALQRRNLNPATLLGSFPDLDARRREAITELESLKARRNKLSEEIGKLKRTGGDATEQTDEVRVLRDRMEDLQATADAYDADLRSMMAAVPNLPHASVPDGADEHGNRVEKTWGEPAAFGFPAKPHWELGEQLGILDFNRAAKIAGSRFVVQIGAGARLERALANFMLDLHTREHGYTEVLPPYMVNAASLFGTGQLPKFEQDLFYCVDKTAFVNVFEEDDNAADAVAGEARLRIGQDKFNSFDHFLIPTAEVPVTNLYRDETLEEKQLTTSLCAYTPCFRSEAGSYGRDVRGMIRQHQFQKVELVKFTTPEKSEDEHEALTRHAETVLERLGLPYRRMLLCTGDMGFASQKTYDLEVWLPGQGLYREISSCSNFGSFQARRANIRYRPAGAKKTEFLHTLNGSGLAVGRTYLAILENYQQADGSVRIPEALQPYMNGETVIQKQAAL